MNESNKMDKMKKNRIYCFHYQNRARNLKSRKREKNPLSYFHLTPSTTFCFHLSSSPRDAIQERISTFFSPLIVIEKGMREV